MLLWLLVDTRGLGVATRFFQQFLFVEVQGRSRFRCRGLILFD